jgi:hypothetical protein
MRCMAVWKIHIYPWKTLINYKNQLLVQLLFVLKISLVGKKSSLPIKRLQWKLSCVDQVQVSMTKLGRLTIVTLNRLRISSSITIIT